ncbi:hypothetical protein AAG906_039458 [Vitis piasezkii]
MGFKERKGHTPCKTQQKPSSTFLALSCLSRDKVLRLKNNMEKSELILVGRVENLAALAFELGCQIGGFLPSIQTSFGPHLNWQKCGIEGTLESMPLGQFHDWKLETVEAFLWKLQKLVVKQNIEDRVVLSNSKSGRFSVGPFYSFLALGESEPFPVRVVWNSWISMRVRIFHGNNEGKNIDLRLVEKERNANPFLSVDALEKMMEDPTVQKMVYPYLPEEMRNPTTFKWMLQNPQYRQQLQDMLNNMGGGAEWDNRMMDNLKNFDLSSPEVKQQFDQIGLTPEEVISKIMANPDVALAFQNPRIQAAIMDCSQNPLSIAKYQNDKEVMDVFNKISELFPGVSGPP